MIYAHILVSMADSSRVTQMLEEWGGGTSSHGYWFHYQYTIGMHTKHTQGNLPLWHLQGKAWKKQVCLSAIKQKYMKYYKGTQFAVVERGYGSHANAVYTSV